VQPSLLVLATVDLSVDAMAATMLKSLPAWVSAGVVAFAWLRLRSNPGAVVIVTTL
jgi:hypothetical protein